MGRMLEFLKEMLDEATSELPGVLPRRAFGSWGYYVNGRIFGLAYAREDRLGVKLPDGAAYAEARGLSGAGEWAPHGSPMSDWVLLPADLHDDRESVQQWVRRAFQLVRAAPAEPPRKPAAAVKRPAGTTGADRPRAAPKSAGTKRPVKAPSGKKISAGKKPAPRRGGR
jgi:TfoX/Sxy family transcriptional regulator of competence genes